MSSAQFIEYNGKQILLMDFSNARSAAEITQTVNEIEKIVAQQTPRSLLGLVDGVKANNNGYSKVIFCLSKM